MFGLVYGSTNPGAPGPRNGLGEDHGLLKGSLLGKHP